MKREERREKERTENEKRKRKRQRNRKEKDEDKEEGEKQITVTAAPFWRINFQLQLQSCLRGELIFSYRRALSRNVIWLPYSRCLTHFFAVLVQFLAFAAFNSCVDCLAEGTSISVNQGRSPPVLRYVIDIDAQLLGANFSALGVNSSGPSLIDASVHSSFNLGLRTSKDHVPSFR